MHDIVKTRFSQSLENPPSTGSIMADDCGRITYGYVDPNFPRPNTDDSACIIIYG